MRARRAIPTGEKMIRIGRMEGVKNDVAHPRIYAGSYPMMYFVAADDKEHAIQIDHDSADMANSEAVVWEFLQQNTWLEGGKRVGTLEMLPARPATVDWTASVRDIIIHAMQCRAYGGPLPYVARTYVGPAGAYIIYHISYIIYHMLYVCGTCVWYMRVVHGT